MIAVDSNVIIDYFQGKETAQTRILRAALNKAQVTVPPAVLAEIFSNPQTLQEAKHLETSLDILSLSSGYWQRAGLLRAKVRKPGIKANLGDALIAQSCIDHDVPLLTTDKDFRHYVKAGGLRLAAK